MVAVTASTTIGVGKRMRAHAPVGLDDVVRMAVSVAAVLCYFSSVGIGVGSGTVFSLHL